MAHLNARDSTCKPDAESPVPADRVAAAIQFSDPGSPVEFDLDLLRRLDLRFGNWSLEVLEVNNKPQSAFLCRGTPMTVQTGHRQGRSQVYLDALGREKILNLVEEGGMVRFAPSAE